MVTPPRGHTVEVAVTRLPSSVYLSVAPGVAHEAESITDPGAAGSGAVVTKGVAATAAAIVDPLRIVL
jgi:hypothetical protein